MAVGSRRGWWSWAAPARLEEGSLRDEGAELASRSHAPENFRLYVQPADVEAEAHTREVTRPSSPAWQINRGLLETVLVQVEIRAQTHSAPLTPLSPEADSAHGLAASVTLFGRCWYQGMEWAGRHGRRESVHPSPVMT